MRRSQDWCALFLSWVSPSSWRLVLFCSYFVSSNSDVQDDRISIVSSDKLETMVFLSTMSDRQRGQLISWREHLWQNPVWRHGRSSIVDEPSKQSVQESSLRDKECNCSNRICLGRISFSSSLSSPDSLKVLKETPFGGNLKVSRPKLNLACWKDMKEAAAKNPDLTSTQG